MRRAKYSAKRVYLPKASTIGYGLYYAKPGNWVTGRDPDDSRGFIGRVLGRIDSADFARSGTSTADCRGWLAVMVLGDGACHAFVKWINPEWIAECREKPPVALMAWLTGDEWAKTGADVARYLAMVEYGSTSESYIADRNDPKKPYNNPAQINLGYLNQYVLR